MDFRPKDEIPIFVRALADPEWRVRMNAAAMLEHVGPEAHSAIPVLNRGLDVAENGAECVQFSRTLACLGPGSRVAIPAMQAALRRYRSYEGVCLMLRQCIARVEAPQGEVPAQAGQVASSSSHTVR